jgi:hypothetical protein
MLASLAGSVSKPYLAKVILDLLKPSNRDSESSTFLTQSGLRFASLEFAICPDLGLCVNGSSSDNPLIDGIKRLQFKTQASLNNRA